MKRNVITVVALAGLAILLTAAPGTAKDPKRQDDLDIRAYLSAFGTPSSDASTEPASGSTTIAKAQMQGLGIW